MVKIGSKKNNYWELFRRFLDQTPPHPKACTQIFSQWKVSWRYTILISFIFLAFVVLKLYIFKASRISKKGDFGLLLGSFSCITTPNHVRFAQNFQQWCSAKQSIISVTVFYLLLKIRRNRPKNPVLGLFFRGFWTTTSDPLGATPTFFVKWKALWRHTTLASFMLITFVVLKLKIFKKFCGNGAAMNWAIFFFGGGGVWALTPPNMVRS